MWAQNKHRTAGFTIVELLIVIVVIAILAAITIVAYKGVQNQAKASVLQSDLSQAAKQMELYKAGNNEAYPADIATANIKASAGTSYQYSTYNTAPIKGYCLTATNGSTQYYTTNNGKATVGTCYDNYRILAQWTMNGNANDSTGNNNGTVSAATLTTGANGQANGAYSFTPSSYINAGTGATLAPGQQVTISAWVKFLPAGLGIYQGILSKYSPGFELNKESSNGLRVEVVCGDGTSHRANEVAGSLTAANTWYFVAGSFDSVTGDIQLFVNGQPRTVSYSDIHTGCPTIPIGPQNLLLGARPVGGLQLSGSLDDVRLYDRILTAPEIQSMYSAGAQ